MFAVEFRSPLQVSGPDIQAASHADGGFGLQSVLVFQDEEFLLGGPQRDAQQVRGGFIDLPEDLLFLFFFEIAVPGPHDPKPRVGFLHPGRRFFRDPGFAAEEEHRCR